MSILDEIKAQQLAEAEKTGLNPYAACDERETGTTPSAPAMPHPVEAVMPVVMPVEHGQSLLQSIKAQQLASEVNPYQPGAAAIAKPAPGSLAHYQAAMSADLASLAVLKDVVEKAKAKQAMIATYWPFVEQYVKNGDHYPNDIAVRVCIWLFDTLDLERGLNLAFVLIKQNQITPPKFDRDLATFVCDAVYDIANALLKADQSASPYLDVLVATMDNEKWSLSPPVHSKLYVMLAKHKKRVNEWAVCLALCEKAEHVNPEGAGVKGLIKEAREKLKPVE